MATVFQTFLDKMVNSKPFAAAAATNLGAYLPTTASTQQLQQDSITTPTSLSVEGAGNVERRSSLKPSCSSLSLQHQDHHHTFFMFAPKTSLTATSVDVNRSRSNSHFSSDFLSPLINNNKQVPVVTTSTCAGHRRSPSSVSLKDYNNNLKKQQQDPALPSLCRQTSMPQQSPPSLVEVPASTPAATVDTQDTNNVSTGPSSSSHSPFIDLHEIKNKLKSFSITFLDCRTANEFQSKHINNSVHVNCRDKLTRKRLLSRRTTVKDLISCKETRSKLMDDDIADQYHGTTTTLCISELNNINNNNNQHETIDENKQSTTSKYFNRNGCLEKPRNMIVLYDDKTSDISELQCESNPLKIVQDNIKESGVKKECKILKGGFQSFIQMFPDMCVIKSECSNNADNPALKYTAYYHSQQPCQAAIDTAEMTKIMPHLYLGNECDACNLQGLEKEGIYYILNVTKTIPMPPTNTMFKTKRIAVNDCPGQNLKHHFEEAFDFIDEAKHNNSKVLVHCQAGVSRSPTIVIAYMMSRLHITMNEAMERVRQQRPIIEPNFVFLNQLKDFEDNLFGSKCSSDEVKISLNNHHSHHSSTNNLLKTLLNSTASFFSHGKDADPTTSSKDHSSKDEITTSILDERSSASPVPNINTSNDNNGEPLTPTSSPTNVPLLVS